MKASVVSDFSMPSMQHNLFVTRFARSSFDLIRAIETDTQPKGSMYDGRAALEMILAIYESHRLNARVELPLKNRKHPLSMLSPKR